MASVNDCSGRLGRVTAYLPQQAASCPHNWRAATPMRPGGYGRAQHHYLGARGQGMATDGERRRFRSMFSRAQARAWIKDNKLFALVLVPALLLRLDAELGYRWQSWFNDSFSYVSDVINLHPDTTRVGGYAIFLKVLEPLHSFAAVTILQHLMGVSVGVMIYALARYRFGAPRWIATLATLPVLFDGFQIQLEHLILSDVPFEFLIVLATTLLLWDRKPSWPRCTLIGLILGIADTVRSVALPLLPIFAGVHPAGPDRLEGPAECAGRLPGPDPALLHLVLLVLRAVRDDREHRGVPVLAGDDLRRMLQDAQPAGRRAGAVHHGPAGPAAHRAGLHLETLQPARPVPSAGVLRAAEPAGRGLRQAGDPGPAAELREDRGLRHDPGVRVEAVRVPGRGHL